MGCGLAEVFATGDQAYAAGLLHDLGKYSEQFLRRLKNPAKESGRDHWSMGSLLAASVYGKRRLGAAMAAVIAGHHVGLTELPIEEDCSDFDRHARALLSFRSSPRDQSSDQIKRCRCII